jgi:hypothetical protein
MENSSSHFCRIFSSHEIWQPDCRRLTVSWSPNSAASRSSRSASGHASQSACISAAWGSIPRLAWAVDTIDQGHEPGRPGTIAHSLFFFFQLAIHSWKAKAGTAQ